MKRLALLFILLLCIEITLAANIGGTVYDLDLEKADNVIVETDTNPKQRDVTEFGIYAFVVPEGSYTITAKYYSDNELISTASEKITVDEEGDFQLDLILFPYLGEQLELADEEVQIESILDEDSTNWFTAGFALFLILTIAYFLIRNKQVKKDTAQDDMGELPEKVLEFIKNEKGRTTQKDIRKQFPSSEAKISLVISELEHKGKIEKIKKGRGNIIVLK